MQITSTRLKRKPVMYVKVVALAIALGTMRAGSLASSAMLWEACQRRPLCERT